MSSVARNGVDPNPGGPPGTGRKDLLKGIFHHLRIGHTVFDNRVISIAYMVHLDMSSEGSDTVFDYILDHPTH